MRGRSGQNRFVARKMWCVTFSWADGVLVKIEVISIQLPYSDRGKVPVEPSSPAVVLSKIPYGRPGTGILRSKFTGVC